MFKLVRNAFCIGTAIIASLQANPEECSAHPLPDLNFALEEDSCTFTAPKGWEYVDAAELPSTIRIFVKGKGISEVPPTLNLAVERTNLTLEQYLAAAKEAHTADGYSDWARLGAVQTQSGEAVLTQIEQETEWGIVKVLQTIMMHHQTAYVLSASAPKEEFPEYYHDFFNAIQSFALQKNVLEQIESDQRREQLQTACQNLKTSWPNLLSLSRDQAPELSEESAARLTFEQTEFQEQHWKPFKQLISQEFEDMGGEWQSQLLNKMHEELLQTRAM